MTWNSTLQAGKPLQRKASMRQATPMTRGPWKKDAPKSHRADAKIERPRGIRSHGMKGVAPTAAQHRFHGLLADVVGCIACRQEGGYTDLVSIHHIDGRTKPDAHWLVLPLCGSHHQDVGIDGVIPVHPYKARFEAAYGIQRELLQKSIQILLDGGFVVPVAALIAAGMQKDCPASVAADLGTAHNALEV